MAGVGNKSQYLVVILVAIFITEGLSVPMSQSCPDTETLRLDQYSLLDIKCGSPCDTGKFEWFKKRRGEKEVKLDSQGLTLTVQSVDYDDEGVYVCQCLPDGPRCEQDVHINPTMEFVASSKYVYTGDPVDLTCTIHSSSPDYPVITLIDGSELPSHDLKEIDVDRHTVQTKVRLHEQLEIKSDYLCVMEKSSEGTEKLKQELSIHSYEPPEILYATDFKVADNDGFGMPGKLVCSILTSPDTDSKVTWLFKDKEIPLDQGKFSTAVQKTSKEVIMDHVLLINAVEKEDLGPYTCQLHSGYSLEDEHEVWIRQAVSGTNNNSKDSKKVSERLSSMHYLVYIVGMVACVLAVGWKCGLFRKKRSNVAYSSDLPINGDPWNRSTATRRKLV